MANFDFKGVEASQQQAWREQQTFSTPPAGNNRSVYVKASSPFTSGDLHLGHIRDYTLADVIARWHRHQGDDVLFTFSFDSFGLPAEIAASERQMDPQEWVKISGERMIEQMQALGFSFDFERVFYTSDSSHYGLTQALFLQLLDADLIRYQRLPVDWCPQCQTTLAVSQVEHGHCWRCHAETTISERPAWVLQVGDYLDENHDNLAALDGWDAQAQATQTHFLGRHQGAEVEIGDADQLLVFTPYADAQTASFILLSPQHPEIEHWSSPSAREQLEKVRAGGFERGERSADIAPLIDAERQVAGLPLLISPLANRFGPSAVLGVPAVDGGDRVVEQRILVEHQDLQLGALDLQELHWRQAHRYQASDFTISRQREWGTPIPVIHCPDCGIMPLPASALPTPLQGREVSCPQCAQEAPLDPDSLDCHFDTLLAFIAAVVPPAERDQQLLDHPDLQRWLPAQVVVGGIDSGGFIFDQRLVTKMLRDLGALDIKDGEPYQRCRLHEMVLAADGRKMSKHLGNAVDPDQLLEQYGADALRFAVLYAAGPSKSFRWSEDQLRFASRFLNNLYDYASEHLVVDDGEGEDGAATLQLRQRLLGWRQTAREQINAQIGTGEVHKALRGIVKLLASIKRFESQALKQSPGQQLSFTDQLAITEALTELLQLLAPVCPHISEHLLQAK